MKCRHFLESMLAAGTYGALAPDAVLAARAGEPETPNPQVKRVLVMFKCHLDVGFIDTQANVIRKYYDEYFPRAIEAAAAMRRSGSGRYVWTTASIQWFGEDMRFRFRIRA